MVIRSGRQELPGDAQLSRQPGYRASASFGKDSKARARTRGVPSPTRSVGTGLPAFIGLPQRACAVGRRVDVAVRAATGRVDHVAVTRFWKKPGRRSAFMPPEMIGVVAFMPYHFWK